MGDKIKKNIFISILISIVIYLALAFYGNYDLVLATLHSFDWQFFPVVLLVIYLTFLLKFVKWQYYLRLINVKLKLSESFHIFMGSLTMSLTPGKVGDIIKSYMIKELNGTPTSKTVPIIFAEKITEFAALIFLVMLGIDILHQGILIPILTGVVLFFFIYLMFNKNITDWVFERLKKIKFLEKYIEPFNNSLTNSQIALRPKPFLLMFLLSIIIWIFEGFGFYLILSKFEINVSTVWSFFTYLFSIFIGSISILPAGLGITDGSITILLSNIGISKEVSVSTALIIRIATLWFSLIIGSISMMKFNKILKNNHK